jgi:hypothetical protein
MQRFSIERVTAGIPGYKPPERRKCRECCKVMRPAVEWREAQPGEEGIRRFGKAVGADVPVRVRHYGYGPEGHFCSLRCAYCFACKKA